MLIMSQNLKPRLLEAATKVTYFTTKAVKMMEVLQLSIIHSQSSGFLTYQTFCGNAGYFSQLHQCLALRETNTTQTQAKKKIEGTEGNATAY